MSEPLAQHVGTTLVGNINAELFSEIVDTVDIIETITKYIELKEDGTFHVGRCPFSDTCGRHFIVSRPSRSYYCFGCGIKGDVISFVSKVGQMNKLTAARFLQNIQKAQQWKTPALKEDLVDKEVAQDGESTNESASL